MEWAITADYIIQPIKIVFDLHETLDGLTMPISQAASTAFELSFNCRCYYIYSFIPAPYITWGDEPVYNWCDHTLQLFGYGSM